MSAQIDVSIKLLEIGGEQLATECRRTGRWGTAAAWLANVLNEMAEGSLGYRRMGLLERSVAAETISRRVALVDGDHREPDIIRLPDGSRVCLHVGLGPQASRWVVEDAAERCRFGQPG